MNQIASLYAHHQKRRHFPSCMVKAEKQSELNSIFVVNTMLHSSWKAGKIEPAEIAIRSMQGKSGESEDEQSAK